MNSCTPEPCNVTKMTPRPIRTKREHQAVLKEIEALWEARAILTFPAFCERDAFQHGAHGRV